MQLHSPSLSSASTPRPAHAVNAIATEFLAIWRTFIRSAFTSYHPEQHYMRGPGPACAAKRKKPIAH